VNKTYHVSFGPFTDVFPVWMALTRDTNSLPEAMYYPQGLNVLPSWPVMGNCSVHRKELTAFLSGNIHTPLGHNQDQRTLW